jgi:hypothetical protein
MTDFKEKRNFLEALTPYPLSHKWARGIGVNYRRMRSKEKTDRSVFIVF